ncbi:hypothetical protein NKI34_14070 [Mesorhizobium sp. M0700]|uniref:hypothetical protein n=1 Tax=Mesorhizobium sp. M0700 TaxID=2956988 RepID=UPI003339F803
MANEVRDAFNVVYADGAAGSPTQPQKSEIRQLGSVIDTQLALISSQLAVIETDTVAAVEVITDALSERVDEVEALATSGILWTNQRIEARSTANVDLATGLVNGQALNGVTVQTGLFYFIGSQTNPAQHGIYPGVAAGASTRATFADSAAELAHIGFVLQGGTIGTGERWTLPMAAADITLGTTALNFAETGIEPGYAAEVQAARGGEATLSDRLDLLSGHEEYGISIYKSDGIAIGGYYAERSANAASTQENLFAEIIAGDVGAEVEFYVSVNGAVTYGPITVVLGTPISLSGLSIAVAAGEQVSFVLLYTSGNVTDFFAKTYGDNT